MKSELKTLLHYLGTRLPVQTDPGVIVIPWLRNTGLKLKQSWIIHMALAIWFWVRVRHSYFTI